MNEMSMKEIYRSKEEKRILTGKITGVESEYYKVKNENIACAIVWYEDIKVLIPITHLGIENASKKTIRGMLGAEIDFIVKEIDSISEIAIASRIDAMKLRSEIELPKIKVNDIVKVRIIAVAVKYIIVDLYGKEVKIKVDDLQHTYIYSCKEIYMPGEYLKARVKAIDIQNNIFELSCKELLENPYTNIRKYITENGEYTGRVIAFPKSKSGVIVQLDRTKVTCLTRVPARFDKYPHLLDNVLIKVTNIKPDKKLIYGYLARVIK